MNDIAILTDTHIGAHGNSENWHNISLNFFRFFADYLKKVKIKKIVFMGDFFDNRNEIGVQTLWVASEILKILKEFEIIMIAGNHDMFYRNRTDVTSVNIFEGYQNITIIQETTNAYLNGMKVCYVPWGGDIDVIENCDVIFGHFEVNGFCMSAGKRSEGKLKPSSLLEKSKLTFSGHFHLKDEKEFSNGKIIYAGSPYQMNWGEVDHTPGFLLMDSDTQKYEFVENKISPRHLKIKHDNINESDIKNNFISIDLSEEESEEKRNTIKNKVMALHPLESRIIFNKKEYTKQSGNIDDVEHNGNLLGLVETFIDDLDLKNISKDVKDKFKILFEKYG